MFELLGKEHGDEQHKECLNNGGMKSATVRGEAGFLTLLESHSSMVSLYWTTASLPRCHVEHDRVYTLARFLNQMLEEIVFLSTLD